MKSVKNRRAITVGIFIFLGIVILIITIFTLGSQKKAFVKAVPVRAVFEDVSGLQIGNNVWLAGVKIGVIKKLNFVPDKGVEVTMNLDAHVAPLIHKDAKAKISSNGLMGNKIVVIYGGTKTAPAVQRDDLLQSEMPISTEDMLAMLQANNKNLLEITGNFKRISKKISDGEGTLGELLNDSSMAHDMRTTILALRSTVSNFKITALKTQEVAANLTLFTSHLNEQGTLMNDLVKDTTVFKDFKNTIVQLKQAADTVTQITTNIRNATAQLTKQNNVAGAMLNDEKLAASFKSAMSNLDSASKNLNEDIIALQHNFFLKGYFKKKNKK